MFKILNEKSLYETNCYDFVTTFEDMKLKEPLLRGIYAYGLEKPSLIQGKAIIPLINGRDVIAQAQSGMGKTAIFAIGVLQVIKTELQECQALILVPTRELALQVQKVFIHLSKFLPKIRCRICAGGTDIRRDIEKMEEGAHIVIGTPGRVNEIFKEKALYAKHINILVLDETDILISLAEKYEKINPEHIKFKTQMKKILSYLNNKRQVIITTATMPYRTQLSIREFIKIKKPVVIMIKNDELTLEGIQQFYVESNYKFDTLCDLYRMVDNKLKTLIFCNKRETVVEVMTEMKSRKLTGSYIHGKLHQENRDQILEDFRFGEIQVLITSDLLSRGIDVQQVQLIINYDSPDITEQYIHRIGRSGRYGRKGMAISIVTTVELPLLKNIEKFYNTDIKEMPNNLSFELGDEE